MAFIDDCNRLVQLRLNSTAFLRQQEAELAAAPTLPTITGIYEHARVRMGHLQGLSDQAAAVGDLQAFARVQYEAPELDLEALLAEALAGMTAVATAARAALAPDEDNKVAVRFTVAAVGDRLVADALPAPAVADLRAAMLAAAATLDPASRSAGPAEAKG